jgi:hypothetical protein
VSLVAKSKGNTGAAFFILSALAVMAAFLVGDHGVGDDMRTIAAETHHGNGR